MSCGGPLPPVPDLIPISALLRRASPPAGASRPEEVMGEQRSRRTAAEPAAAADPIDSAGSRGPCAAPQARKVRHERHRKSDRRREHRKPTRQPDSKRSSSSSNRPSPEWPAIPRVNPIFVFVRQVDTRIVDVKCEDYDRRNRILLTKTAQGWRAIPRTETLVPTLKGAVDQDSPHHRHHHRSRKSKRAKCRRKSAAVQVEADVQTSEPEEEGEESKDDLTWMAPVNVESLLPSHKILVKKASPDRDMSSKVNSAAPDNTQTQSKCSADQISDVSPLDNLLAVAELEFNQQMQSDEWNKNMEDNLETTLEQLDDINSLIESCSNNDEKAETDDFLGEVDKQEECDYNEEEENNIAMDDILTRLEQSLQSPECTDISKMCTTTSNAKAVISDINENNYKSVPEFETFFEETAADEKADNQVVESSTTAEADELPTDLTVKNCAEESNPEPTDLSVPKFKAISPPPPLTIPRSPSQNSEAIQSPQPSGIPAVPPSPDIPMPSKTKAVFLETLLSNSNQKIALNSEVTIIRQKEPLDLGKCRKSASPTVTCSEEVNSSPTECLEPPAKKFKSGDITLKNLLDKSEKSVEKLTVPDTPRLLELLKTDAEPDPLTQLRQVVNDLTVNVPDPMLVPKEKLSSIISHPGREIPKLLKQRPELRLPEALAYPHLLQDPDILVITLQQLETIIMKQGQSPQVPENKQSPKKKPIENSNKPAPEAHSKSGSIAELANDIDAATTAAFNQMMWLPYLNQLEAMSFANNPEVMKMFNGSAPMYPGQMHDIPNLFMNNNNNRFPPPMAFPMQPPVNFNSPLEMSMWQEAVMQANMLRPKHHLETLNPKHNYRETPNYPSHKKTGRPHSSSSKPGGYYPYQNQFLGVPRHNLQVPQYTPVQAQKKPHKSTNFNSYYNHLAQEKQQQQPHPKPKLSCKSFASAPSYHREKTADVCRQTGQPIDLSGSTVPGGKLKVKQHLVDPANAPKLLKHHHEDVPEVGSTTASIEEMQDAHKHLWHPLFGNQKGYSSPWNWTTVTATGE